MAVKTYSALVQIPTFLERFHYLKLNQSVGAETFGENRYLNQVFYRSDAWQQTRRKIILRDNGCDLGVDGYFIPKGKAMVHHIEPISTEDLINRTPKIFDPDNLITISTVTHRALTYGDEFLFKANYGEERTPNDQTPWKKQAPEKPTLYLMCGLPGSGKSTYCQEHIPKTDEYISRDAIRYSLLQEGEDYFSHEPQVKQILFDKANIAINSGRNVWLDQTSIYKGSRANVLNNVKGFGKAVCVIVNTPIEVCLNRNENRRGTIAYAPRNEIERMYNDFVVPTVEEGFDKVIFV